MALAETTLEAAFVSDHSRLAARLADALEALHAGDWRRACHLFGRFARSLRKHIGVEDATLFPAFERETGMIDSGPTVVMRREHAEAERRLTAIAEVLERASDAAGAAAQIRALGALIEDHAAREERILYPACDRILGARERAAVLRGLSGRGRG